MGSQHQVGPRDTPSSVTGEPLWSSGGCRTFQGRGYGESLPAVVRASWVAWRTQAPPLPVLQGTLMPPPYIGLGYSSPRAQGSPRPTWGGNADPFPPRFMEAQPA